MPILVAETRTKSAKATRRENKIPAILYGPGLENLKIAVNKKEFEKFLKEGGEGSHFVLKIDEKEFLVVIKEIQRDPLTEEILHVDFFRPSETERIEMRVPLVFEGVSPAVKNLGGILVKNISEIELRGFLKQLPKEIKVNINKLATFEDKILVKDLEIPEGVEVLRNKEDIVAFVAHPEKVEETKATSPEKAPAEKEESLNP